MFFQQQRQQSRYESRVVHGGEMPMDVGAQRFNCLGPNLYHRPSNEVRAKCAPYPVARSTTSSTYSPPPARHERYSQSLVEPATNASCCSRCFNLLMVASYDSEGNSECSAFLQFASHEFGPVGEIGSPTVMLLAPCLPPVCGMSAIRCPGCTTRKLARDRPGPRGPMPAHLCLQPRLPPPGNPRGFVRSRSCEPAQYWSRRRQRRIRT